MSKLVSKSLGLFAQNSIPSLLLNTEINPHQSSSLNINTSQNQSSQLGDEAAPLEVFSDEELSGENTLRDADISELTGSRSNEYLGSDEELTMDEDPEFPGELKAKTFHYMCELIKYRTKVTDNEDDRKKAIEIFDKFLEVVKGQKKLVQIGIRNGRYLFWGLKDPIKQSFNDDEKIKIINHIANKLEIEIKEEKKLHKFGYLLRALKAPFVGDFIANKLRPIEKEVLESWLIKDTPQMDYNLGSSDSEGSSSSAETTSLRDIEEQLRDTPRNSVTLSRVLDSEDPEFPNELKIKAFLFINDLVKIEDLENIPDNHKKMIDIFDQSMEAVKANKGFVKIGLGFDHFLKRNLLIGCVSDPKTHKLNDDEKIQIFDHIIKQVDIPIEDQEKLIKFTTLMKCLQMTPVKRFLMNELNKIKQNMANSSQLVGDAKGDAKGLQH